jgi:hypothetical protein
MKYLALVLLPLGFLIFSACGGSVRAEQPIKVEPVQAPGYPDVTCFVIRNEMGNAFAGNCVKMQ